MLSLSSPVLVSYQRRHLKSEQLISAPSVHGAAPLPTGRQAAAAAAPVSADTTNEAVVIVSRRPGGPAAFDCHRVGRSVSGIELMRRSEK